MHRIYVKNAHLMRLCDVILYFRKYLDQKYIITIMKYKRYPGYCQNLKIGSIGLTICHVYLPLRKVDLFFK